MTMDESVKEIEYISEKLKLGDIVTYQDVAHEFGSSYKKSKVILYKFFKSNKSNFIGQFIINGVIDGSTVIKFIESEKLIEEAVEKFDKIDDIYCYSVTPKSEFSLKDFAIHNQKNVINTDNLSYYHKLGLIKGPELVPVTSYKTSKPPVVEPVKSTAKVESKPKKEKTISLMSNYVSRKQKPAETSSTKRTSEPPKYQYKSRKLENKKPEKVVVSNDVEVDEFDEFDEMEVDKPAPSLPTPKTKLSDIFNDDNDSEELEIEELEKESTPKEDTPQEDKQDDRNIQEIEDPIEETPKEPENVPEPVPEPEEPEEPQYDEEGYLITYNTKKSKPKPKPRQSETKQTKEIKPPVKSAVKPTKDKKSKQPSVMSFFGKKK